MVVTEDAGIMAVVEVDLHRVVAHLRGRLRAYSRLEHRQRRRRNHCRWRFRTRMLLMFLVAFFVTRSAGTFFAQIRKLVVADVVVRPGDIDAGAGRHMNLDS